MCWGLLRVYPCTATASTPSIPHVALCSMLSTCSSNLVLDLAQGLQEEPLHLVTQQMRDEKGNAVLWGSTRANAPLYAVAE